MKKTLIKSHIGYLSLVSSVIPLIISIQSHSVNVGGNKPEIFIILVFTSLFLGIYAFSNWQGKISITLFFYFFYRLLTDMVCMTTA